MNRETLDFLTAGELTEIGSEIDDLLADAQITVAVTYRDFQSRTFSPSGGTAVVTYTDTTTRAFRHILGAREVAAGEGLWQIGDVGFLLAQSDVGVTPNREDRLVVGSETYEVISWETDPLSKTWWIVARRVK